MTPRDFYRLVCIGALALIVAILGGCGLRYAVHCTPWPSPLDPEFCAADRAAYGSDRR